MPILLIVIAVLKTHQWKTKIISKKLKALSAHLRLKLFNKRNKYIKIRIILLGSYINKLSEIEHSLFVRQENPDATLSLNTLTVFSVTIGNEILT